jgi:hypothetical protein
MTLAKLKRENERNQTCNIEVDILAMQGPYRRLNPDNGVMGWKEHE